MPRLTILRARKPAPPAARVVWSAGRPIDFDRAVRLMDRQIFRRVLAGVIGRMREQVELRRQCEAEPDGLRLLAPLEKHWLERYWEIWEEYTRLHFRLYGVPFEPNLPRVQYRPSELDDFFHARAFADNDVHLSGGDASPGKP